ncbi:MAG: hypothetical protein WAN60_20370 [Candidatus Sulfotelmatobacter sp.]
MILGQHIVDKPVSGKLGLGKMERLNTKLHRASVAPLFLMATFVLFATLPPVLPAREKDKLPYGEGLIVNVPFTEAEVEQVVQDVAQNGIIRGTKEYNKDEYVSGANPADSTHAFPPWTGGGKVFYKVRLQALDPRNFKDAGDVGTLAVRYVLQPQGNKNTVLRIDAVFVEEFRHTVHASNGSVESSEYKDIKDHLDAIELMKQQTVEAEKERQNQLSKKLPQPKQLQPTNSGSEQTATPSAHAPGSVPATAEISSSRAAPTAGVASDAPSHEAQVASQTQPAGSAVQSATGSSVSSQSVSSQTVSTQSVSGEAAPGVTLEKHVHDLRQQVERLVKSPGAPLKSAPFHTASTLSALTTGTEVLILISTPYWYGVETRDGQHGWIFRDSLEALP